MWKEEDRERQTEKNNLSSHTHQGCYHNKQIKQKITSVGKNVEKLELLCTVDGNVKWCSHYGKTAGQSLKNIKNKITIWFINSTYEYTPKGAERLPRWLSGKESTFQCRRHRRCGFNPCVRKIAWITKWQPALVFLPGKFHGQRSLAGYNSYSQRVRLD